MGTITGVARACAEAGRPTAVLWLDAHADYNTPETTPSGNMHGMALSLAAGDPILAPVLGDRPLHAVAPADITLFGARSIDPAEKLRLSADGVDAVDMRADRRARRLGAARRAHRRWCRRGASRCTSASTSTSSTRRWRLAPAPSCPAAPPTARRTW